MNQMLETISFENTLENVWIYMDKLNVNKIITNCK